MQRISNIAFNFNRDFPEASGLSGIPRDNSVRIARDWGDLYDRDAAGIWLNGCQTTVPLGWLYRKDANRDATHAKLDAVGEINGHVDQRVRRQAGPTVRKVVLY